LNPIRVLRHLQLAQRASYHSDYDTKVGAVLVVGGHVVGFGFNKDKTHPAFMYTLRTTTHAEISACTNYGRIASDDNGIMFVYREDNNGVPALARPCEVCRKFMYAWGIRKVYYTTGGFLSYGVELLTKEL
jgi:tRNA(Arg) A34 adenosine deaminase TadA